MRSHTLVALVALCSLASVAEAEPTTPLVHVQTDKPSYRLGEAIWFRVHASPGAPDKIEVALVREGGQKVASKVGTPKPGEPLEGEFPIPEDLPGGTWKLVATSGEQVLHEVSLDVYDVSQRTLDLELTILGDSATPGGEVVATLAARDLRGHALAGEVAHWTARFGPLTVSGSAPALDDEGRAVIRFMVPANAQQSGSLSVGVESQKLLGAVARPVHVFAGIARVDAFPEGGAIVSGASARVGLLVRGPSGEPALVEGRVVDETGYVADAFSTDRRGLALVEVPYDKDRTYSVAIDRPAGVTTRFPLPGPTGHARSLRVDYQKGALLVRLRGQHTTRETHVLLVTAAGVQSRDVEILKDGGDAVASFEVDATTFGAGHVIVVGGKTAELKTPVVFGDHWPLDVTIVPRPGKQLPGEIVTLDAYVTDHTSHKPVSADLAFSAFQKGVGEDGLEDLPVRALLNPVVSGTVSDVGDLFRVATVFGRDFRSAYVLARGGFALPPAGVPLVEKSGLPAESTGRVEVAAIQAPPPPEQPRAGDTVAQGTPLERLMERAPWTRHELPRPESDRQLSRIGEPSQLTELPVHAKAGMLPPQDTVIPWSKVDCRDTLLWRGRVVTDSNGHATLAFRLGHEVTPLRIVGEGFARGGVALATAAAIPGANGEVALAEVKPLAPFSSQFDFPTHLTVGDSFDLNVTTVVRDGSLAPVAVELLVPACLKALDRVQRTYDPRKDESCSKFRFEVVGALHDARLTVTSTRAPFRETATSRFSVSLRDLELSCGKSGLESGTQSLSCQVPADAIPGSVTAFSRVVDSRSLGSSLVGTPAASTIGHDDWILREPDGCFEQTTSSNYPNLVILSRLLRSGGDAHVLHLACELCNKGYERILTFQNAEGGFSLWQGGTDVTPKYTAMAIVQLSLYGKLFQGRGATPLAKAVAWLQKHPAPGDDSEAVFVALSANEAGIAGVATRALTVQPRTNYERALVANCVADWNQEWPLKKDRATFLKELVQPLASAMDPKTGRVPTEGVGIMGSSGEQLEAETTALTAVAFVEAGFLPQSHACLKYLTTLKSSRGSLVGTRANALALRALDRLGLGGPTVVAPARAVVASNTDPVVVSFFAGSSEALTSFVGGGTRNRPLAFEVPIAAAPGSTVALGLDMKTTSALEFGFGLRYRVAKPRSSPDAPFALETTLGPIVVATQDSTIGVTIKPTGAGAKVTGQVLLQVSLPGGCVPVASWKGPGYPVQKIEHRDGALLFYFEKAPEEGYTFSIPIRGQTPGNFVAPPAVIYPYYESGREAYAAPLETKVLPAYDAGLASQGQGVQPKPPARPAPALHR